MTKEKIYLYRFIGYFILFILIAIFSLFFDIFFISKNLRIISYILYYAVAINGLYSFYKAGNKFELLLSEIITITMLLLSLVILVAGKLLLLPPIILLLLISFKKNYHLLFKITKNILVALIILMFILIIFTRGFDYPDNEILDSINSPDKKHRIVQLYVDQGALGGTIIVKVERNYWDLVIISKRIMLSDKKLKIEWLNDKNIMINGIRNKGTLL